MAVERSSGAGSARHRVLVLFGTRPEAIKLAPVMWALEGRSDRFETVNVASGQHRELVEPFVRDLKIRVDHDLAVGRAGQTPSGICQRTLIGLEGLLEDWRPDAVLVQGDTTTALAGALAANQLGITVGHVEAGLRSGNPMSPFPEEMNRRLITGLARFHFAATEHNRETLLAEGVGDETIAVTGKNSPAPKGTVALTSASVESRMGKSLIEDWFAILSPTLRSISLSSDPKFVPTTVTLWPGPDGPMPRVVRTGIW